HPDLGRCPAHRERLPEQRPLLRDPARPDAHPDGALPGSGGTRTAEVPGRHHRDPRRPGGPGMITYILRRVLQAIPTLLVASVLIWLLVYALPGDPAIAVAGDNATPEAVEYERRR